MFSSVSIHHQCLVAGYQSADHIINFQAIFIQMGIEKHFVLTPSPNYKKSLTLSVSVWKTILQIIAQFITPLIFILSKILFMVEARQFIRI